MLSSVDDVFNPSTYGGHAPVLLRETLALFKLREGSKILDATFGGGGHTSALLEAAEGVRVVALDRDPAALERARPLQDRYGSRFQFISMNFSDIGTLDAGSFDCVLFDFGVSSFQLDCPERGFSFRADAPLDMRMNPQAGMSAAEFLESADEASLVRAIRNYGEEKSWRRVVASILEARGTGRLQRTESLSNLIAQAVGSRRTRRQIHPATRTFQGIRVEINDELNAIEQGLPAAFDRLTPGGVLAAISFHSLEDRIVKRFCRRISGRPEHAGDGRTQDQRTTLASMVWTRPVVPEEDEVSGNPRSRSARLRAVRRLEELTTPTPKAP